MLGARSSRGTTINAAGVATAVKGRALANATVHVMDTPGHVEEAILWEGDRIVAVGRDQEIRRLARQRGIEVEDLGGRVVLPGFVDAHTHFLHVGLKKNRPDLRGARSLDEALARLRAWLAAHPGATPVIGDGWDESEW
ncbi:MAG TPA: amidohydrolase family protein, partial [Candidatus Thermoplasmatota archaeon]|nr:amidohydrolase family protein [Candidatus Thermoplasmatota archaeon]